MLHGLLPDFSVHNIVRKTRHGPDRDPVLRGVLAENVEQEKGGAAKEQRVIDNQHVNPRHTCLTLSGAPDRRRYSQGSN
jgi:hypothetical protein